MRRDFFGKQVRQTIEKHAMLVDGDTVMVAVSGGPDSIALLNFLNNIKKTYGVRLHVFHLNHKIRGDEADKDARFVADFTDKLGLSVSFLEFDVPAYAKQEKLSIEEAARDVRYRMMTEVAIEIGATKIALGHHADDQVETFLMRMVRGAGSDGLSAMQSKRGVYIRPFLDVEKKDILDYLAENNLSYRIDASNEDVSLLRNSIRYELLPLLMDYNPGFKESVIRTVRIVNEDRAYLNKVTEELFENRVRGGVDTVSIAVDDIIVLALAIQRRLVRKMIERIKGDLKGIEFKHIETIVNEIIRNSKRFSIDLTGEISAHIEYGQFKILKHNKQELKPFEPSLLKIPGETDIPEIDITIVSRLINTTDLLFEKNGRIAHLDADKIQGNVMVRTRKRGDAFFPLGMDEKKKLQDFFVDNKIERRKRDRVPILVSNDDILWVAGHRIDNRYRVTAETRRVLVLKLEER